MELDPKAKLIIGAIRDFISMLEKIEQLADPNEQTTIDDMVLSFLRMLIDKFE